MGRAPCCDKANVKRGPWSPEEDAKLKSYIELHGTAGNWIALPQKIGLRRCGKSCRLRWLNYLRPNIKHGGFSEEEDNLICSLYISIGSRWSIIAAQLPGRTDNDIKNYWNTRLKKKLLGKHRKDQQSRRNASAKKQEIMTRKGAENSTSSYYNNNNNQNPYFPELPLVLPPPPMPCSNQESLEADNHDSLRKLLMKLGGRFCDGDINLQYPDDISTFQPLYEQQPMNCLQPNSKYWNTEEVNMPLLTGESSSFASEFEEIRYDHNVERSLGGLEFLYSDMISTKNGSSCSWDEMMMSSQLVNSYYGDLQQVISSQECSVSGELSTYPGLQ